MKKLPVIQNITPTEISFKSFADYERPIYMDNAASTQVDEDAVVAMIKAMEDNYGNPSGIHEAGKQARESVEEARKNVANFIGCLSEEVVFTSGGTESITTTINSATKASNKTHIISCLTEHGATLNKLKDFEDNKTYKISYLDVDKNGHFRIEQLEKYLQNNVNDNLLVSLMAANNETGTIHNNIEQAIKLAHQYGALFHLDAVQIAGKLPIKPYIDYGVDFLSLSGHKFHCPKGIGALFVKSGTPFYSTIVGGSQENNRRAGTENVPAIVAMGVVCKKMPQYDENMEKLHNRFIELICISIPSCIINGGGMWGTISVGFAFVHREAMVYKLSQYNVYASIGSACSKGIQPSHVLKAMNIASEYVNGSIRFSFSKYTTMEEIETAAIVVIKVYYEIRKLSYGIIV